MLLQRFIKKPGPLAGVRVVVQILICATIIVGCGSTPKHANNDEDVLLGPDGQPIAERAIPPQAQLMYEQAVAVMASGDFLEAQLRFQEFLLHYPTYPGAHVNLAIIYSANGDDHGTENSLTDALMIDPEHPAALNQLGMLLRRQGKFPEAKFAYAKAITADPQYSLAHYNLGVLHELYLQDLDIALQHYEQYQALNGDDKQVEKWIVDLKRRIGADQRTANVTE